MEIESAGITWTHQQTHCPQTKDSLGSSPDTGAACSVPVSWQPVMGTWEAVAAAWRTGRGLLQAVAASLRLPVVSCWDKGWRR